jgi:hypothetical protein
MIRPMPGGPPLIRRVFNALWPPTVAAPTTDIALRDRIWMTTAVLARDLAEDPRLGWRGKSATDLWPIAERLAWHRWLFETGRLDEGRLPDAD